MQLSLEVREVPCVFGHSFKQAVTILQKLIVGVRENRRPDRKFLRPITEPEHWRRGIQTGINPIEDILISASPKDLIHQRRQLVYATVNSRLEFRHRKNLSVYGQVLFHRIPCKEREEGVGVGEGRGHRHLLPQGIEHRRAVLRQEGPHIFFVGLKGVVIELLFARLDLGCTRRADRPLELRYIGRDERSSCERSVVVLKMECDQEAKEWIHPLIGEELRTGIGYEGHEKFMEQADDTSVFLFILQSADQSLEGLRGGVMEYDVEIVDGGLACAD